MADAPPTIPRKVHSSANRLGRWYLAAVGLSLVFIGSVFIVLMARSFLRAKDMRTWPQVPCVILSSEIEERRHDPLSPVEYRAAVVYGYEWNGAHYSSDQITLRGSAWTSDRSRAEQRAAEFPNGTTAICHIHPTDPKAAVLKPDSLAPGYAIWFPGLFVIAGLVIAIRALRPPSRRKT
jgi:hypothetical protein